MKLRTTLSVCLLFLTFFTILSSTFAEGQSTSYEQYLSDLHAQGKERVIVRFKDTMDSALIERYEGQIIHTLPIINAIVCEIPQANIELLQGENAVQGVSIDGIIKADTDLLELNKIEYSKILRVKKEYLHKKRMERIASIRSATQEYLVSNKDSIALQHYKENINLAKETYELAAASWFTRVSEIISYEITSATPEWENLSQGLNAVAAWDRYGVTGTGIKIAFIDTGVNYNLSDLGGGIGPSFKCLAGRNFFITDPQDPMYYDPIPFIHPTDWTQSEMHGTSVASNSVGSGASQIVGPAKNASYYSLRILSGPDATGPTSNAIAAIQWCLDPAHKPDIINMSFGAYASGSDKTDLEAACNAAYNAGIILVAASGNDGYTYSAWPASFANVISVGGHAEDQTLLDRTNNIHVVSNGGVDFVAPGEYVRTLLPEGISIMHASGTSTATGCASGALALALQYARQTNGELDYHMKPNHGYLWELLKHSAEDMPLIVNYLPDPDPNCYKGKGKVWAADTAPTPPDLGDGSIDCMAANWPLSYAITYPDPVYIDELGYPAYYIGTNMDYTFDLTNNTDTAGNYTSDIENLNVTTTQAYYIDQGEANLPGVPLKVFTPISLLVPAYPELLLDNYFLDWNMYPGLDRTILDMQFEFTDDTNNRLITVTYPYAGIWCPPAVINEGFPEQN